MAGFITDENGNLIEFTGSSGIINNNYLYDVIIRTQKEFDSFCESIDNNTCTAKSILFVGDGGTLVFTKEWGGILLPSTVCEVKGINNAKISIEEGNNNPEIGIAYTGVISADNRVKIEGIDISVNSSYYNIQGIKNFYYVNNCVSRTSTTTFGVRANSFYGCTNLENCISYFYPIGSDYQECVNLVNCTSISGRTSVKYTDCENIGALTNASNLSDENVASWKEKLTIERSEIVYDKDSTDSVLNWGYTSGIEGGTTGTTISNKDFNKFKKLKIYFDSIWGKNGSTALCSCLEIDLINSKAQGGFYKVCNTSFAESQTTTFFHTDMVIINSAKTSITLGGWQNCASGSDASKNVANGRCYKIIGVY